MCVYIHVIKILTVINFLTCNEINLTEKKGMTWLIDKKISVLWHQALAQLVEHTCNCAQGLRCKPLVSTCRGKSLCSCSLSSSLSPYSFSISVNT